MRKIVAQLLRAVGDRIWPRAPVHPDIEPIDEKTRREVAQFEDTMRAELVRAQSEALRLRSLQGHSE